MVRSRYQWQRAVCLIFTFLPFIKDCWLIAQNWFSSLLLCGLYIVPHSGDEEEQGASFGVTALGVVLHSHHNDDVSVSFNPTFFSTIGSSFLRIRKSDDTQSFFQKLVRWRQCLQGAWQTEFSLWELAKKNIIQRPSLHKHILGSHINFFTLVVHILTQWENFRCYHNWWHTLGRISGVFFFLILRLIPKMPLIHCSPWSDLVVVFCISKWETVDTVYHDIHNF